MTGHHPDEKTGTPDGLPSSLTVRGTCVALKTKTRPGEDENAPWGALLLRGPSGAGKSDLALRLIDRYSPDQAILVSDDYTNLAIQPCGKSLRALASPPKNIAGRLEIRGVGIMTVAYAQAIPLTMLVDLVEPAQVERLPAFGETELYSDRSGRTLRLPLARCAPFEESSVLKLYLLFGQFARHVAKSPQSGD